MTSSSDITSTHSVTQKTKLLYCMNDFFPSVCPHAHTSGVDSPWTCFLSTQHYVDGAVSDNLPRCDQGNTITISPYAGESDLCPRATTLTFHEVRFNNVSIQVNSENLYRVTSTFFPPDPEVRNRLRVLQHKSVCLFSPGSPTFITYRADRVDFSPTKHRVFAHPKILIYAFAADMVHLNEILFFINKT